MIISHKHKFVFLKTRKTAGTSLEMSLSGICGPQDVITPLSRDDEYKRKTFSGVGAQNYLLPLKDFTLTDYLRWLIYFKKPRYYNHDSASKVSTHLGENTWQDYFTFCFERNPEDKLLSHYQWLKMSGYCKSVKEYMEKKYFQKIRASQIYLDGVGKPMVDKVYKMEELAEALDDIRLRLELSQPLSMPKSKAKSSISVSKDEQSELLQYYKDKLLKYFEFERQLYSIDETNRPIND